MFFCWTIFRHNLCHMTWFVRWPNQGKISSGKYLLLVSYPKLGIDGDNWWKSLGSEIAGGLKFFFPRQRCIFSKLWPPRKRHFNKEKAKFETKDNFFMHRILIILLKWLRDNFYETVVLSQRCWRSCFGATLKYPRPAMESNIFYDDIQLKSAAPSNSSFSHSLHRGLD